MELNKNPQGLTAYDILKVPGCPHRLPTARSMTQAAIDYNSLEPVLFKWYAEHLKQPHIDMDYAEMTHNAIDQKL